MFVSVARAALLCGNCHKRKAFQTASFQLLQGVAASATRKWSQDDDDQESARAKSLEVEPSKARDPF